MRHFGLVDGFSIRPKVRPESLAHFVLSTADALRWLDVSAAAIDGGGEKPKVNERRSDGWSVGRSGGETKKGVEERQKHYQKLMNMCKISAHRWLIGS